MTLIPFPSARRSRLLDLAHPHPSAIVIVLPESRSVEDQMRQHGIFPSDDCFTDADKAIRNRTGDA